MSASKGEIRLQQNPIDEIRTELSQRRQALEKSRATAFRLIRLNLTIISIFSVGIVFGVKNRTTIEISDFFNCWLIAGGLTLAFSTLIATTIVIKTTFDKAELLSTQEYHPLQNNDTQILQKYQKSNQIVKILVGSMIVSATWTLPLFFAGVSEPLFEERIYVVGQPLIYWIFTLHFLPTIHFLYRSYDSIQNLVIETLSSK